MLILINGVVIIIFLGIVLYLTISYQQTQRALIWWHSKQWMRMYEIAEGIQNGLLQESFVIRRQLELSLVKPVINQQQPEQYYLATMEKFYHSLNQLSSYLSPPYIEDSLPLAIQHKIIAWSAQNSKLKFYPEMPITWYNGSIYTNQLILMVLEQLLIINSSKISHSSSTSLFVKFIQKNKSSEIVFQFNYLNLSPATKISRLPELNYICRVFSFLTRGKSHYYHNDNMETWRFCWASSHADKTKVKI